MCVPGSETPGIPVRIQLRGLCRGQALTLSDFQSWLRAFVRLGTLSHGVRQLGEPPASPAWPENCRYQPGWNTNESWYLPPTSCQWPCQPRIRCLGDPRGTGDTRQKPVLGLPAALHFHLGQEPSLEDGEAVGLPHDFMAPFSLFQMRRESHNDLALRFDYIPWARGRGTHSR